MASSKVHKLMGAGAATLIAEPALALAHQGGLGIIVGLVIGAVAYGVVDEVEQRTGGQPALPVRNQSPATEKAARGGDGKSKPTLAHRLLVGKSVREAATTTDDEEAAAEDETVIVPEQDSGLDHFPAEEERMASRQSGGRRVPAIYGENPRRRLLLAENFQPDANRICKTGGFFAGVQGSGKTTAMVRTCEQYIKNWRLGGFYFDIKGIDFKSLVTSGFAQRGLIVTQENIEELDERYAEHGGLVRTALHNQWQVAFDLPTWHEPGRTAMSRRLISQMMTGVINDLMAEAAAIPPGTGRRPFIVAIDEVQRLAPQSKKGDPELLDALVGLSTTGRAAAVVPFFACPRIAEVDKDLIGSVELRAFGQATLLQDVQTYRKYVGADAFGDEEIRGLGTGEMIVCMGESCVLAQFYDRETPHGSHNASVDDALAGWERGRPPTMPALEPNPMHRSETPAPPPESLHEAERTQHFAKGREGMGPELQAAYDAYRPGMNHHTLARYLGTAPSVAGQLLKQLQQRGLIDAAGNKKREKVVPIVPEARLRAADIDLEEAIQAWNEGYNSEDKLMRRFPGLTKWQAGLLRDRMFPPAVAK